MTELQAEQHQTGAHHGKNQSTLARGRTHRGGREDRRGRGDPPHDLATPGMLPEDKPAPINPIPLTAPASALGAAASDSAPITAVPTPINENVRPSAGDPRS